MQLFSYFAIYFIVWWLCLFVVLPFGVRSQRDEGEVVAGTEAGAPSAPRLAVKLIATSILAAVVMALALWALSNPVIQEYWT